MREGWGWETRGSLSSPGNAGGVGDASIVTVSEGRAGGGGRKGHCHHRHGSWVGLWSLCRQRRWWGHGLGCGHSHHVIDTSSGVVVVLGSWSWASCR